MSEHVHETELLTDITARLAKAEDVESFISGIRGPVARLFRADRVIIWLVDPLGAKLRSHEDDQAEYAVDDEAVIPAIYRTSQTIFSGQAAEDERINADQTLADMGINSLMAVPVQARQRTYGVAMLGSAAENAFVESQLSLLKAIAGQIGAAVHGANVHHDLQRREKLMAQINRIGGGLTGLRDLESILEHITQGLHLNLNYGVAQIWLREGPDLILHSRGVDGEIAVYEEGPRRPVTDGVVGRAARTARSLIARDLQQDPDFSPIEDFKTMRSALQAPIISGDKVIGVLDLIDGEVGTFDESDRQAIETLAAQVAIALENVRLNDETQQRLFQQAIVHQISQDLITIFDVPSLADAVVFQMAQALDTTGCLLALLDEASQTIRPQAFYVSAQASDPEALNRRLDRQYQLDELAVVRQTFALGTPIELQTEGPGDFPLEEDLLARLNQLSALVVPLMTSGHHIGVIVWLEDRRIRHFRDDEVRLAQILANQASVALEHARLHDATQRQLSRETILRKVAETANSWADQHTMLDQFAQDTNLALGTSLCNIYLFDDDSRPALVMQRVAEGTQPPSQVETTLDLEKYPSIHDALNHGRPLYMLRDDLEGDSPEYERLQRTGYVACLIAPLIYRDALVGVIEVWDRREEYRMGPDAISLLEALARQASIAVDSARQYTREQQRLRLLERVQETSQLISASLNQDQLMRLVAERVTEVFEIETAIISLYDPEEERFNIRASHGISEEFREGMRLTYANYVTLMGEHGGAEVLPDVQTLPMNQNYPLIHHENLRTVLMIPLKYGERLLGFLSAGTVGYVRRFGQNEIEMAQLLGRQIAIAIHNAQLFEVVEERAEALAEANRLKTEFLANVSHELRTPMNSVIGFSQSIAAGMYGELNEQQANRLEIVLRSAQHLLDLIDDLLDLSKIDAGRMELQLQPIAAGEMLEGIFGELAPQVEEKALALEKDLPDNLPKVYADERRLRQVFVNLVSNAIKFTDKGGVTVSAETLAAGAAQFVHFSVADSGMGIAPEDHELIFDAFRQADGSSTREYGGTGMGLAITKRLVELMEGRVWVESTVGEGATFHVLIPVEGIRAG